MMAGTDLTSEGGPTVDMRLEVVVVPVSDVDRAKAFYSEKVGSTWTWTSASATGSA